MLGFDPTPAYLGAGGANGTSSGVLAALLGESTPLYQGTGPSPAPRSRLGLFPGTPAYLAAPATPPVNPPAAEAATAAPAPDGAGECEDSEAVPVTIVIRRSE